VLIEQVRRDPLRRSSWCATDAFRAAARSRSSLACRGTSCCHFRQLIRFSTANSSGRRNLRRTPLRRTSEGVHGHLVRSRSV